MEYLAIPTVFERNPETNYKTLTGGVFATEELRMLASCDWIWTEKVDGTNIRVMFDPAEGVSFGGRTDNAQIQTQLLKVLMGTFNLARFVTAGFDCSVALYGEGCGAKIQKGGGNYKATGQMFVLFDVRCGGLWLKREDVLDIACKMNIECVPEVGRGPLWHMVEMVRAGFCSYWGDFLAEGIVARPNVELRDRRGNRIITKVKHKDFARQEATPCPAR